LLEKSKNEGVENVMSLKNFEDVQSDKDFTRPQSIRFVEEVQNYLVTGINRRRDEFRGDGDDQKKTAKGKKILTSSFSVSDYVKELNRVFKNGNDADYVIPNCRRGQFLLAGSNGFLFYQCLCMTII
jgi:hypothetical protein